MIPYACVCVCFIPLCLAFQPFVLHAMGLIQERCHDVAVDVVVKQLYTLLISLTTIELDSVVSDGSLYS